MALKINKQTAIARYNESPDWLKTQFEQEFGKETFQKFNFLDIKTFSDVCKADGTTEQEFNEEFGKLRADTYNYEKLVL